MVSIATSVAQMSLLLIQVFWKKALDRGVTLKVNIAWDPDQLNVLKAMKNI